MAVVNEAKLPAKITRINVTTTGYFDVATAMPGTPIRKPSKITQ